MNYYLEVLKKYAVFSGRAQRKEYWYFTLINLLVYFLFAIIDDSGALVGFFYLAMIVPHLAVGVRRMHDVNKSGWFIIVPIYNLILSLSDGTKGDNEYGSNPKGIIEDSSGNKTILNYCHKCGTKIENGSKFCKKCGNKITI